MWWWCIIVIVFFINKCCIYFGYLDSVFVILTGLVDLAGHWACGLVMKKVSFCPCRRLAMY